MKLWLFPFLAISARAESRTFDLVVYGATAGGVTTAVSAAREGLKAALVDPSHHVGGMVAGGLSSSDKGEPEVIGGLSREFFERVGRHYHEPIEWAFEPHVAEQVFRGMLQEASVGTFFQSPTRENKQDTKQEENVPAVRTQ